jgi:hypothetical protein
MPSLTVDRLIRGMGRLRFRTGTKDPSVVARINEAITKLRDRGDYRTLRELAQGQIRPMELIGLAPEGDALRAAPRLQVYALVARPSGYIKIGITGDVSRRVKKIGQGTWEAVNLITSIPATRADEAAIHERLKLFRVRGEWYLPDPVVLALIDELTPEPTQNSPHPEIS